MDDSWGLKPEEIQGTDPWLEWRKHGLGASDAPIIMGVSPWKTPYGLWLEKTGRKKSGKVQNWAQARGHRLEGIARAKYTAMSGISVLPKTVTNGFLLASLDGWNDDRKTAVEIKCPGYPDHVKAMSGEVPEKYIWQLVHQFIVSEATFIDYFSYHVEKDADPYQGNGQMVRVRRDKKKEEEYLVKAGEFWNCIKNDEAPDMTEKDYQPIEDGHLKGLLSQYKAAQNELSLIKDRADYFKEQALDYVTQKGWTKIECDGIKVYKVSRQGTIDTKKMIEEESIDGEKYRKASSEFFRIDLPKEDQQ